MAQPDLLQQQREILCAFRATSAVRAKAEADAETHRKIERGNADGALDQVKQTAISQVAEANKALDQSRSLLANAGLERLFVQGRPVEPIPSPSGNPAQELTRSLAQATKGVANIQAGLEDLTQWRTESATHSKRLRVALLLALAASAIAIVGIIALIWWGLQPCEWVDSLKGHPSGCLQLFRWHSAPVRSIAFSPDRKMLASASEDYNIYASNTSNKIILWDLSNGQNLGTITAPWATFQRGLAFFPDGKTLVFSRGSDVILWDVVNGRELRRLSGHQNTVNSVAISPQGSIIASGSEDGTIRLWDSAAGRELFTLSGVPQTFCGYSTDPNDVTGIAFSPDGKIIASVSLDVKIWDVTNGRVLHNFCGVDRDSPIFSPTGNFFALGGSRVNLWDTKSWQRAVTLNMGPGESSVSLSFSPDGKMIATAGQGGRAIVWDLASNNEIHSFSANSMATSLAFSPDGTNLAVGEFDGTVKIWEVK